MDGSKVQGLLVVLLLLLINLRRLEGQEEALVFVTALPFFFFSESSESSSRKPLSFFLSFPKVVRAQSIRSAETLPRSPLLGTDGGRNEEDSFIHSSRVEGGKRGVRKGGKGCG